MHGRLRQPLSSPLPSRPPVNATAEDHPRVRQFDLVTVSALRFFYTVTLKRPWTVVDDIPTSRKAKKLPVVLSQDEVTHFLGAVDNLKHRVILIVCYATGLRISEAVRLKPAAIDSQRMVIRVDQGKGHKDRYVMLPPKLLAMLRGYWKCTHPGEWLFPGDRPGQAISPLTIGHICRITGPGR
jgi:integrase/recombinase XerD